MIDDFFRFILEYAMSPHPARRNGFTLTELLVAVVVAVAVLGLFLALPLWRERARMHACAANMRGVWQETQAYTQNFGGFYPYLTHRDGPVAGGTERLHEALCGPAREKSPLWPLFSCPADSADRSRAEECFDAGFTGFGLNALAFITYWEYSWYRDDNNSTPARVELFPSPGDTLMFTDTCWTAYENKDLRGYYLARPCCDPCNPTPYPRHNARCNFLWVDGHASVGAGETYEDLFVRYLSDPWHKGGLSKVAWFRNPAR